MRVAIVCDFLTVYSGAEKVIEQLLEIWPDAGVFALTDFMPKDERGWLKGKTVTTTFIQNLPFARTKFRSYLPLFPLAIEQLDVSGYDVVISCSHAVAKGVITAPEQLHLCMCYTPIRYAWDMEKDYLEEAGLTKGMRGAAARYMMYRLRQWDVTSASRVDEFIAISNFVAARIQKYYRRNSTIIFPPVDVDTFQLGASKEREDFYLTASRLVTYKKVPVIVEAFKRMPSRKLVVFGDGPDFQKVAAIAEGVPNIRLAGYQPQSALRDHMQRAKAFVYAAKEDFGIVLIEAQACGAPAIAFGGGAASDTVRTNAADGSTGVLFGEQTPESICNAVEAFEARSSSITSEACRRHAQEFSNINFRGKMVNFAEQKWREYRGRADGNHA